MTIFVLLLVLSGMMWYMTGHYKILLNKFYSVGTRSDTHSEHRSRGWEIGGADSEYGWSWIYGFIPYYGTTVVEQPISLKSEAVLEQPCATDLDCPVGHCSMFGMCATQLTL